MSASFQTLRFTSQHRTQSSPKRFYCAGTEDLRGREPQKPPKEDGLLASFLGRESLICYRSALGVGKEEGIICFHYSGPPIISQARDRFPRIYDNTAV